MCLAVHGKEEIFQKIHVEDGTLFFEDGSEVALWGVNFQTSLSWEHRRFASIGMLTPFDLAAYQKMADRNFDEIQLMGCDVIRIHLGPGDFADAHGDLVENEWLAMLDYTLAECRRRGIYVNLAFLNSMGNQVKDSFIRPRSDAKWEWVTVPRQIEATKHFIRALVNRKNPYDDHIRYKDNPAWVVAELINEPMFPLKKPDRADSPEGVEAFEQWLKREEKMDTNESFGEFKYQSFKRYIDEMIYLLEQEEVAAVPCWNLYWVRGPHHQGWEGFEAAADSNVELVSFSTYPGQSEVQAARPRRVELSDQNFLPYLKDAYEKRDWQAWLRDDRFKGRKARIVYEYEGWSNQSAYLYPAMAQYFRAQGAQIATMWTYSFSGLAESFSKTQPHNLNLRTTPRKAASFMVAGEVFRHSPRYAPFVTTTDESDRSDIAAFSFAEDFSASWAEGVFIHAGDVDGLDVEIPDDLQRLVGYGDSPWVRYDGKGLYFLTKQQTDTAELWALLLLPHAAWTEGEGGHPRSAVKLDSETPAMLAIDFPGLAGITRFYAVEPDALSLLKTWPKGAGIEVNLSPGSYLIERVLGD